MLLDILFLAIIAAFIAYRYYNILGRKDENLENIARELHRINIEINNEENKIKDIDLVEPITNSTNPNIVEVMNKINSHYPEFNEKFFLSGSLKLFEILISAYAKGDLSTIEKWASNTLYNNLKNNIESRNKKDYDLSVTIVSISKNDIIDALIDNEKAYIKVHFESDQISIIRDQSGNIIKGNPKAAEKVSEVWVFTKDLASTNLNWVLDNITSPIMQQNTI